jgi:hypothetical protein
MFSVLKAAIYNVPSGWYRRGLKRSRDMKTIRSCGASLR